MQWRVALLHGVAALLLLLAVRLAGGKEPQPLPPEKASFLFTLLRGVNEYVNGEQLWRAWGVSLDSALQKAIAKKGYLQGSDFLDSRFREAEDHFRRAVGYLGVLTPFDAQTEEIKHTFWVAVQQRLDAMELTRNDLSKPIPKPSLGIQAKVVFANRGLLKVLDYCLMAWKQREPDRKKEAESWKSWSKTKAWIEKWQKDFKELSAE